MMNQSGKLFVTGLARENVKYATNQNFTFSLRVIYDRPITDISDLVEIQEMIASNRNWYDVLITNWKWFED